MHGSSHAPKTSGLGEDDDVEAGGLPAVEQPGDHRTGLPAKAIGGSDDLIIKSMCSGKFLNALPRQEALAGKAVGGETVLLGELSLPFGDHLTAAVRVMVDGGIQHDDPASRSKDAPRLAKRAAVVRRIVQGGVEDNDAGRAIRKWQAIELRLDRQKMCFVVRSAP